jgi:hypothetical protein
MFANGSSESESAHSWHRENPSRRGAQAELILLANAVVGEFESAVPDM